MISTIIIFKLVSISYYILGYHTAQTKEELHKQLCTYKEALNFTPEISKILVQIMPDRIKNNLSVKMLLQDLNQLRQHILVVLNFSSKKMLGSQREIKLRKTVYKYGLGIESISVNFINALFYV